ncbi:MAG: hypothetical protein HN929_13845 [Chloroflexi bacterium]|nr:hypothetical protein [Chloroflexota bacterium]MBT7082520.1 hypothetical protein [Chloroflexota bacterium]
MQGRKVIGLFGFSMVVLCIVLVVTLLPDHKQFEEGIGPFLGGLDPGGLGRRSYTLLYTSEKSNNADIYRAYASGEGSIKMTDDPITEFDPMWSPNGTMISYTYKTDSSEVYVMMKDGSNKVSLGRGSFARWSPDGSKLAFVFNGGIWTISPDGSDRIEIGMGQNPVWSPDNSRIAYMLNDGIWVMNADGSERIRLTSSSSYYSHCNPVWLAGGTKIAYTSIDSLTMAASGGYLRALPTAVWTVNVDGSSPTQIHGAPPDFPGRSEWSPDGSRIVFAKSDMGILSMASPTDVIVDQQAEIWVMDADASNQTMLAIGTNPMWLYDGSRIVYELEDDIWMMDSEGNNQVNVTDSPDSREYLSVWAP